MKSSSLLPSLLLGMLFIFSGCLMGMGMHTINEIQTANSETGILGCTRRGDTAALAEMLKQDPTVLNHQIPDGNVPLVVVQDVPTTDWLLAHGADPNLQIGQGLTPFLAHLNKQSINTDILEDLLRHGANVNEPSTLTSDDRVPRTSHTNGMSGFTSYSKGDKKAKDGVYITDFRQKGETPLHFAAVSGNIPYMNMLIAHGAKIDATEDEGYTPLHVACEVVNLDAVKVLLDHGANINAKDEDKETPLKLCITSNSTHDKTQLLAYLREHGATE